MPDPRNDPRSLLTPANPSEIEFAPSGVAYASDKLLVALPGTKESHSAAHELIDWLTIEHFGTHALPCCVTCDPTRLEHLR